MKIDYRDTERNGKVFFTSDTHFGHENIIKLCKRPFKTIQEHDDALVKNWNSVVSKNDTVFVLGDMFYRCSYEYAKQVFAKLNAKRIYIIRGNHDQLADLLCQEQQCGTPVSIDYYMELTIVDHLSCQDIMMFHYPIEEWNKYHKGAWSLYGHQHNLQEKDRSEPKYDVGVDLNNYTPIEYTQLKQIMHDKALYGAVQRKNDRPSFS